MGTMQRLLLIVGAVVVIVAGYLLLSGSGDDGGGDQSAVTTAPATAPPVPAPAAATIAVRRGKPLGGVATIGARKGDRINIVVTSPDTTEEVHLHGYDIKRDLKAGGQVSFSFTADAEGIFEMELEDSATQIAKIVVRPR
jgi:hypothetical protein